MTDSNPRDKVPDNLIAGLVPEEWDRSCDQCGYRLTGLIENRCPECGTRFNPFEFSHAKIPWLAAPHIGKTWAFIWTVAQIAVSPFRFSGEICRARRQNLHEAIRFKRYCIWLSVGGSSLAPIPMLFFGASDEATFLAATLVVGTGAIAVLVFLYLGSALPLGLHGRCDDLAGQCLQHYTNAAALLLPLTFAAVLVGPSLGLALLTLVGFFAMTGWLRLAFAWSAYKLSPLQICSTSVVLGFWWLLTLIATLGTAIILGGLTFIILN